MVKKLKRKLYSEPIRTKSDNATLFYLKAREIEPGWIRYITFATANDLNQSNRDVDFGKLVGDEFYPMEGTTSTDKAANEFFTRKTHVFRSGEFPAFRWTNATVDNVLHAYFEGYEVQIEEAVQTGQRK